MKKIVLIMAALVSFSVSATSIECYQGDGDDRFDLKMAKGLMAIAHTNDSDESSISYYDAAEFDVNTGIITAGRYVVKLNSDLRKDSSLSKYVGRKLVLLTDILECSISKNLDIDSWVSRHSIN